MDFDALPDLIQHYMPTRPWAQNLLYMAILILGATVAQWRVAKVGLPLAPRMMIAM